MANPLLPPLEDDGPVAVPVAGVWNNKGPIGLEDISKSLKVMAPDAIFDIDSIPNMWARPILFEMALYDDKHPLHDRILGEWRGLLTMLALKEWYNFQLTIEPIEILPDDAAAPEFLQALRKLLPQHTLDKDTKWDQLDLILYKGKPIGLTSPTTLVCTAVDCSNRLPNVPWVQKTSLCDPTPELNVKEREAVAGWLNAPHAKKIDALPILDLDLSTAFQNRIKDIAAALKGLIAKFTDDLGPAPGIPIPLAGNLGFSNGVFLGTNNPVEIPDLPSSVELVPSRADSPDTVLLVADEAIAEQWEVEPKNVVVWGPMTLATYQTFSSELRHLLPEGVRLRKPKEDFFTEKLFVIDQKGAFPGTLSPQNSNPLKFLGGDVTPILPIKEELLAYLNVADLNKRITFANTDAGITVTLKLPLTGQTLTEDDRENWDLEIAQEYSSANGDIVLIPFVPVLEIWPNFKRSDWQVYYTYFTTSGQDTLYAKPFLLDGTPESRSVLDNKDNIEKEITKTFSLPEAMLCEYKGTKAGVLLISVPEALPAGKGTWTVGVDFGTTSTTVYSNGDGDDPKAMEFDARLIQVTESGAARQLLYNEFLPVKSERTPFLSLFQKSDSKAPKEPLLDGHIYFLDNFTEFVEKGNIVSNLKWSDDPDDKIHTQVFLKQLCLQCAAEAVAGGAGEINWRFSFPTAFSQTDKEAFEIIWHQVVDDCAGPKGLKEEEDTVSFEEESIVTAKFFASIGVFAKGAVCIDIGGETSDISIWQDGRLFWHTSLRFAGRHIFLNLLKENPGFLKNFDVPNGDINQLEAANDFYAQTDALIKERGQDWLNQLPLKAALPGVQTLVQRISVGVAGLLYYVGLLLKYLGQEKEFEPTMPNVYIGGNGSRILHWLASGNFTPKAVIMELLEQVLLDASEFDREDLFKIQISPLPKHEAAFGLIDDKKILKLNGTQFDQILAGEAFTEDGTTYEWTESLTADWLVKGLKPTTNLEQIGNFVKSFNNYAKQGKAIKIPIKFGKRDNKDLFDQLLDQLQDFKDADPHSLHIEPLFILALKYLLEQ